MWHLLTAVGLSAGVAAAQEVGPYQQLLEAVGQSTRRVVVFAPSIFDVPLADALRQSHFDVVRRPAVRLLTVEYYNYLPGSTVLSLALAGVPVSEAQVPSREGFVIVDDQGWIGPRLGQTTGSTTPGSTTPGSTLRRMTRPELNASLAWLQRTIQGGHRLNQYEAYSRLKKVLK
jgi:hypothetical protein